MRKAHHLPTTMEKDNLFVAEEEDVSQSPASEEYHDFTNPLQGDEDPIIQSIPLVHAKLPDRASQSIHVLQYTGKGKNAPFVHDQLKATMKPESKVVEVKIPMDTLKFYDEGRTEELGSRVETLALQGVLTNTDGGLYVGKVVEKEGGPQIVLLPLDSTAQLRPLFKYIDDLDTARTAQLRQESSSSDPLKQNAAVQVLQTASKAGQMSADGHSALIGSCLKHIKKFNEEEWQSLSWRNGEDSALMSLKERLVTPEVAPVSVRTVFDEFA